MRTGKLVFQGSLDDLRSRDAARILVRTAQPARAAEVLTGLGLPDVRTAEHEASAQLGGQPPEEICARLVHADVPVAGLETLRTSLEDLLVELTGEGFHVDG